MDALVRRDSHQLELGRAIFTRFQTDKQSQKWKFPNRKIVKFSGKS